MQYKELWFLLKKVTTNIIHPSSYRTMSLALYQHCNNRLNCTVKASVEQNFVIALKQIQLSSHICFIPLPTELFHDIICVFRTQNNKSNDPHLLVMAHCNYRTRSWTRRIFGTCPQCSVRCEQENTEIFKLSSLRKNSMDNFLLKFKDTGSVSSHEMCLLYRIAVMLRQQQ